MLPHVYLSQAKFHQSVKCTKTLSRVSYALIGDWERDDISLGYKPQDVESQVVLYILPSGCSRYIGMLLDGIASRNNVRMLAIDRPGAGATKTCSGAERMQLATQQMLTVLRHLGVINLCIFAHSVGWLYTLNLISTAAAEGHTVSKTGRLRIVLSSPFVPTHISGSLLSALPRGLIEFAPTAFSSLAFIGKALTWSSGFVPSSWTNNDAPTEAQIQRNNAKRQINRKRNPSATFHPPYTGHFHLALNRKDESAAKRTVLGETILFEYFQLEHGPEAAVQDFLFCLGKGDGLTSEELANWFHDKLSSIAKNSNLELEFVILWADSDGLIPKKGRQYFMKEILSPLPASSIVQWVMAKAGHDEALGSTEVMDAVFAFLQNGQMPKRDY